MNTKEIIKLAREVGGLDEFTGPPSDWIAGYFVISPEQLSKFAAIVRNVALEECASEFQGLYTDSCPGINIAAAIRALKENIND